MDRYIPRIGDSFGDYKVISEEIFRGNSNKKKIKVQCKCGTEKILDYDYLKNYLNPICSKCAKKEQHRKIIDNRKKNGTLHKGIGCLNKTFINSIKQSAIRRGYKWLITIEELWYLYLNQDKKCKLSGLEINFSEYLKKGRYDFKNANASLDRIDSSKDYTLDNVQWVHKDVNRMKNIFSQEYFIKICKNVAEKN